ncbi:MAG: Smr/MutS family protein [Rickettsiales bacterium]|nr:Smr/MutS family protein [Pseudomonadota bacterium]MDA0965831.1 Smr/MutS family protein [Pseudomonadota bacterium]MDG4542699.1 Smr/MutS family protein [Rickettsiales bacterium]MDG4545203.1 Smr/MutS family protein [Rickettsiales bacterium]MDG4547326.1 Smr/MutS family protein [Rickettsiales bacterium]
MEEENNLTDEDLELWYYVSKTVEPLHGREPVEPPAPQPTDTSIKTEANLEDIEKLISQMQQAKISTPRYDYIKHGTMSGVDKSTAKKLTGGKFQIDASLDLHGKTQDDALYLLRNFINSSYSSGKRNVLVITGKGANNDGILKNQVPRWLNNDGLRERIIMFSHAKPKHGGDGALYVLLRKNK